MTIGTSSIDYLHSSQSGEIFGILENMLDTFNADLKQAREDEAAAVKQFTELKKLKEEQIARDTEQLRKENEKYAAATTKLADSEATKADCEDSLEKDTQVLNETTETCTQNEQEMSERTKARAEELEGVGKALGFLNSDEAHELFGKALGFLQVESTSAEKAREVLRKAGNKYGNPEILSLAQKVPQPLLGVIVMCSSIRIAQRLLVRHRSFHVDRKRRALNRHFASSKNKETPGEVRRFRPGDPRD